MITISATKSVVKSLNIQPTGGSCCLCNTRRVCQSSQLVPDLPSDIYDHLFQSRLIKSGKHLFHAGDELTTFYIIRSGTFKTYLNNEWGDEHITSFYMPGDALGADALDTRKHQLSCVALESSSVCAVPIKKLESEVKRFSSDWLLKQACQQTMRESHTFLMSIRNNANAFARIALFLIKQSELYRARGYSGLEFRLAMKRGDIANYLGLAIETVSRTLHRLQEDSVLIIKGRHIIINNLCQLKKIAGIPPAYEQRLSA